MWRRPAASSPNCSRIANGISCSRSTVDAIDSRSGDCLSNEALAYVVPADDHVPARQAATGALHRWLASRSASAGPGQPGPSERWRLIQWLRMLDALDAKASSRDLAAVLILPDSRHYSAAEWDASSERRRISRWQRSAIAMREGGYLKLLAGG